MHDLTRTQAGLLARLAERGPFHRNCGWTYATRLTRGVALLNLAHAGLVELEILEIRGAPGGQRWRITDAGRQAIEDIAEGVADAA